MRYLIDNLIPHRAGYDDRHFLWKCVSTVLFVVVVPPAAFAAAFGLLWLLIVLNGVAIGGVTD